MNDGSHSTRRGALDTEIPGLLASGMSWNSSISISVWGIRMELPLPLLLLTGIFQESLRQALRNRRVRCFSSHWYHQNFDDAMSGAAITNFSLQTHVFSCGYIRKTGVHSKNVNNYMWFPFKDEQKSTSTDV